MKKQTTPVYRTQHTWKQSPGQIFHHPSKTIPGDAYTIAEIMEKARGGIPVNSLVDVREDYLTQDEDMDTIAHEVGSIDHADIYQMSEQSKEVIADASKKLKQKNRTKAAKGENSAVEAETAPSVPEDVKDDSVSKTASKEPL